MHLALACFDLGELTTSSALSPYCWPELSDGSVNSEHLGIIPSLFWRYQLGRVMGCPLLLPRRSVMQAA